MRGFGAYAGLGLDVPMTKFGTTPATGHPAANNTGTCSDSFAVQQMLTDLGFPTGGVDGLIGNNTFKALASFATSTGTPYSPGDFPRAPMCQALMDAWTAAKQPAPVATAPVATAPVALSPASTRLFINPATIAAVFAANKQVAALPAPAPSSGGTDWWSGLSTPVKVGIIGGGVAMLGLLALVATRKKKVAAANRRRRRARRNHHSDPSRPSHAGRLGYTHFVLLPTGRIASGWEFKNDADDARRDLPSDYIADSRVYTRRGLMNMGIDPSDPRNWSGKLL